MRKKRVELSCGIFAMSILITVSLSCIILGSTGQYVPRSSNYSSYEISENPPMPDFYYPLANYSLVRSGSSIGLFEKVGLQKFESGNQYNIGLTNITYEDRYGTLDIHETPTTVIQYSAAEDNTMKFQLSAGTGATKRGTSVVVGNEAASGIFFMRGVSVAAIYGQDIVFTIPSGSGVIFRADTDLDSPIGNAVAGGRVSAEMHLLDAGWTIGEDVVSYDGTWLYAATASEEVVEVMVSGQAGEAIVIHVSEPYLNYADSQDLVVKVDGTEAKLGTGMTETLWDTGDGPSYYIVKTADGFDVIVHLPQNADSVITVSAADADFGVDGIITLLAAIGIVAVAVVALLKSE